MRVYYDRDADVNLVKGKLPVIARARAEVFDGALPAFTRPVELAAIPTRRRRVNRRSPLGCSISVMRIVSTSATARSVTAIGSPRARH